jgi:GABA(A) receptor-associated protein
MKFKLEHNLEQRVAESSRIRSKYPERIPVICEKSDKSKVQVCFVDEVSGSL